MLKRIGSGLAWIAFSPLFFLMAVGAGRSMTSNTEFHAYLVVSGAWAVAAVIAGVGTMATARFAERLKTILLWIPITYYMGATVIMAVEPAVRGLVDPLFALVTVSILGGVAALRVLLSRHRKRRDARLYGLRPD